MALLISIRRENDLYCFLFAVVLVYDICLLASSRKVVVLPAVLVLISTIVQAWNLDAPSKILILVIDKRIL